jgi:hypothetical protein
MKHDITHNLKNSAIQDLSRQQNDDLRGVEINELHNLSLPTTGTINVMLNSQVDAAERLAMGTPKQIKENKSNRSRSSKRSSIDKKISRIFLYQNTEEYKKHLSQEIKTKKRSNRKQMVSLKFHLNCISYEEFLN